MRRSAQGRVFYGLNTFQGGAGGIFFGLNDVHGTTYRAGGVNTGAARFVGKADKVRIAKAVFQLRYIRALTIIEVQDGLNRYYDLGSGTFLIFRRKLDDGFHIHAGVSHHAGGQYQMAAGYLETDNR